MCVCVFLAGRQGRAGMGWDGLAGLTWLAGLVGWADWVVLGCAGLSVLSKNLLIGRWFVVDVRSITPLRA